MDHVTQLLHVAVYINDMYVLAKFSENLWDALYSPLHGSHMDPLLTFQGWIEHKWNK